MKAARRIAFRVDAGRQIGSGHVMRCLTLAAALRERDAEVRFVMRQHDGHLCELAEQRGYAVARLPAPTAFDAGKLAHGQWLGASLRDDAAQTKEALEQGCDWLVTDHYGIDANWQRSLREKAPRILALDDLADRELDADLLLDQNILPAERYDGRLPASCRRLVGPAYALLQPQYAGLHGEARKRSGAVKRLLVFFGGMDVPNLAGLTLSAFFALGHSDVHVDVVVASSSPHLASIQAQAAGRANVSLHHDLPSLAPLMAHADLAIGAGGATTWERICLLLPTLVVTLAENQREVAADLQRRGLIEWLGDADKINEGRITEALGAYLDAPRGEACFAGYEDLVDGRGAAKVADAMLESS